MEFLQNYGFYILIGIMFLFMMRGGGCCGGHGGDSDSSQNKDKDTPKKSCH